ncbi:MAG: hypothetical protein Q4B69_03405 [Slackia sp.]|nr:hypothetical protein [Slackia sp.]
MAVFADRPHDYPSDSAFAASSLSHGALPWDMRLSRVDVLSIDPSRIERAVEGGISTNRLPVSCKGSRDVLHNLGLACGGVLTNAAALLFAPSEVPLVACRAYDSAYRSVLRDGCDCYGPFDEAFDRACAFFSRNISFVCGNGCECDDSKMGILAGIIREVLMNAMQHRDYFRFAPVRLTVWPGCIEVANPGYAPDSACFAMGEGPYLRDPQEFVERALGSRFGLRNALLAQALYRFGVVDGQGAGIARIAIACEICDLRASLTNDEGWAVFRATDSHR